MPRHVGDEIGTELVIGKYGDVFHLNLRTVSAAVAANYTAEWIAPRAIEIIQVDVAYTAPSTSGTLQLEALTSTQAPGAGATILDSTIPLSGVGTENIVITRTQEQMTSARAMEQGDRIGLIDGGTLTGLTDLIVSVYYKPRGRGNYR